MLYSFVTYLFTAWFHWYLCLEYWSKRESSVQQLSLCPLGVRQLSAISNCYLWNTWVRTTMVPACQSRLAGIWWTGAYRCVQLWFLGISLSWWTLGGHMADTCFTFGPKYTGIRTTESEKRKNSKKSPQKNPKSRTPFDGVIYPSTESFAIMFSLYI